MRSLEHVGESELHYSSVMGISRSDIPRVREILVKAVEDARAIIRTSTDEEIYAYSIDLFAAGKHSKQ